jgi:hypothetical protein
VLISVLTIHAVRVGHEGNATLVTGDGGRNGMPPATNDDYVATLGYAQVNRSLDSRQRLSGVNPIIPIVPICRVNEEDVRSVNPLPVRATTLNWRLGANQFSSPQIAVNQIGAKVWFHVSTLLDARPRVVPLLPQSSCTIYGTNVERAVCVFGISPHLGYDVGI